MKFKVSHIALACTRLVIRDKLLSLSALHYSVPRSLYFIALPMILKFRSSTTD